MLLLKIVVKQIRVIAWCEEMVCCATICIQRQVPRVKRKAHSVANPAVIQPLQTRQKVSSARTNITGSAHCLWGNESFWWTENDLINCVSLGRKSCFEQGADDVTCYPCSGKVASQSASDCQNGRNEQAETDLSKVFGYHAYRPLTGQV